MKTQAPKCYSYCRYSSKIQAKGQSLQRQIERSKNWATDRGLVLDESTITDLGISGYSKTSNNVSNGALGKFLGQIKEGKIPPKSILIVESLDRLSRAEVLTAFDLFREIIKHNIKIVTLTDNQEYDEESLNQNIGQLMISLTIMARAFEESDTKSQRLKAVWGKKRENINKKRLTKICPMWLRLNPKTNKFEKIREKVAIIKRIFEMSADGYGYQTIIKILNEEKIPSFRGKSWGQTYIRNVLHGKAVLGEFTPHLKENGKRIPLEPIQNYYPQIISYGLYQKVHDRFNSIEHNKGGGKNGSIRNLFGLIGRCGYCNGPMRFINKGPLPKGGQYLVCNRSCLKNEPDCFKLPWRYDEIEESFLNFSIEISASDILDNITKTENEKKIKELQTKIDNLNEIKAQKRNKHKIGYKNLTKLIQNKPYLSKNENVENLFKDLEKINEEINEIGIKLRPLISKINEIKNSNVIITSQLNSMQELIKLISYKNDEIDSEKIELRFKLRNEIRNLIERIYFLAGGNIVPDSLVDLLLKKELDRYIKENANATRKEIEHMKKFFRDQIHKFQQPNIKNRYFVIFFKSGAMKALKFDVEKRKIEMIAKLNLGSKIKIYDKGKPLEIEMRKFDKIEVINDIIEYSFINSFSL